MHKCNSKKGIVVHKSKENLPVKSIFFLDDLLDKNNPRTSQISLTMLFDGSSIHENLFLLFILAQEVAAIISAIKKNSIS